MAEKKQATGATEPAESQAPESPQNTEQTERLNALEDVVEDTLQENENLKSKIAKLEEDMAKAKSSSTKKKAAPKKLTCPTVTVQKGEESIKVKFRFARFQHPLDGVLNKFVAEEVAKDADLTQKLYDTAPHIFEGA